MFIMQTSLLKMLEFTENYWLPFLKIQVYMFYPTNNLFFILPMRLLSI